jgi:hypothetical protein
VAVAWAAWIAWEERGRSEGKRVQIGRDMRYEPRAKQGAIFDCSCTDNICRALSKKMVLLVTKVMSTVLKARGSLRASKEFEGMWNHTWIRRSEHEQRIQRVPR